MLLTLLLTLPALGAEDVYADLGRPAPDAPGVQTVSLDYRVGAGDAVLSLVSLCVAQDSSMEIAGFIGNVVGAEAVAALGHRKSVERASLYKHVESLLK